MLHLMQIDLNPLDQEECTFQWKSTRIEPYMTNVHDPYFINMEYNICNNCQQDGNKPQVVHRYFNGLAFCRACMMNFFDETKTKFTPEILKTFYEAKIAEVEEQIGEQQKTKDMKKQERIELKKELKVKKHATRAKQMKYKQLIAELSVAASTAEI